MVTRLLALLFAAHPLHTTMTEMTVDPTAHTVRAVTRGFADDLGKAAHASQSIDVYVVRHLSIVDRSQRAIALQSCGTKRAGDVLWVCVEGRFTGAATELHLSNALLCDLFDDQVNIVQSVVGSARRSLLFVKGDRSKSIT